MDMNKVIEAAIKAGALEQVSKMIDVPEEDAGKALNVVLPLLLKGMQSQAKSNDTKEGFFKALDDHGKNDPKDVKKFLKNVDTDDGAKIVNHLLGQKQEEVAAKATKRSGLDKKTILKIMAIAAPFLMSQMGKNAKSKAKAVQSDDMLSIVGGLLDGVDASDVIKIVGKFLK